LGKRKRSELNDFIDKVIVKAVCGLCDLEREALRLRIVCFDFGAKTAKGEADEKYRQMADDTERKVGELIAKIKKEIVRDLGELRES